MIWSFVGFIRFISEKLTVSKHDKKNIYKDSDVAVLIPAHNEQLVIKDCIKALKYSFDPKQIYVVSDGSIDKTYDSARNQKCHISRLNPGRGKAKALIYLLKKYHIYEKYKFIFIVDADTKIDKNFLPNALLLFNDPSIGVVFATSQIKWPKHTIPRLRYYFIAYRDRLNRLIQYYLMYGQTWKYTSISYVLPGFAVIYRSKILKKLEIYTPGLLIEDFNLAFQYNKKKLGKIGYNFSLIGWDQYPDNLADYWKQVRRWNIGFFQTVMKNGVWPSLFWLSLGLFSFEVILHSIFLILFPLLFLSLLSPWLNVIPHINVYTAFINQFWPFDKLTLFDVFIAVFLIDYTITLFIGFTHKKPQFAFYGLFFFFLHYVTSLILISSIIPGLFGYSSGRWNSPNRQSIR